MMELLIGLVVIGTSLWVLQDASTIGVRKGLQTGVTDMGVGGWFFCCLLFWIIAFPLYLSSRQTIIAAVAGEKRVPVIPSVPDPKRNPFQGKKVLVTRKRVPPVTPIQTTGPVISCPLCSGSIPQTLLLAGSNLCDHCGGEFNVDFSV